MLWVLWNCFYMYLQFLIQSVFTHLRSTSGKTRNGGFSSRLQYANHFYNPIIRFNFSQSFDVTISKEGVIKSMILICGMMIWLPSSTLCIEFRPAITARRLLFVPIGCSSTSHWPHSQQIVKSSVFVFAFNSWTHCLCPWGCLRGGNMFHRFKDAQINTWWRFTLFGSR